MKKSNPEKLLDTQELSALENQTLKGGNNPVDDEGNLKKKKGKDENGRPGEE